MKILFWLNKKHIYCRITVRGERAEISTGIKVIDDRWDQPRQEFKKSTPDNITLGEMKLFFQRQALINEFYTARTMKQVWEDRHRKQIYDTPTLAEVWVNHDGIYKATLKQINAYCRRNSSSHHKVLKPRLDNLDQPWADGFGKWLQTKVKATTAHIYFSKLEATIRRAIADHPKSDEYPFMIEKMPFKRPELATEENGQGNPLKYLSLEQYEKLKQLKVDRKEQFFWQCFIFQCATGMSFVDMKAWDGNVNIDINSQSYIRYDRVKTGVEAIVPNMEPFTLPLVHHLNREVYNKGLKEIGNCIGYPGLTSHVGRHTFGVLRLHDGFSMESVMKMMGHSSIRTTEKVYAKVTIDKIFKEKREIS